MHMRGDWEVLLNGDPQEIRQLCTWGTASITSGCVGGSRLLERLP